MSIIYRAFADTGKNEFSIFVEAYSKDEARKKIKDIIKASFSLRDSIDIYNIHSDSEMIENGYAKNEKIRLLESSWRSSPDKEGMRINTLVTEPLFMLTDFSLMNLWVSLAKTKPSSIPVRVKKYAEDISAMPTSIVDLKALPEETGEVVMSNATTNIFIKNATN